MKVARTVWSGGKLSDYFKELPITIKDWEMMTESDKDEIINKKIIREL